MRYVLSRTGAVCRRIDSPARCLAAWSERRRALLLTCPERKLLRGHIGEDPEMFVSYLMELGYEGELEAEKAINVLKECNNAREFLVMIQPFKEFPEYEQMVIEIESREGWLDEVIRYIKLMMEVQ